MRQTDKQMYEQQCRGRTLGIFRIQTWGLQHPAPYANLLANVFALSLGLNRNPKHANYRLVVIFDMMDIQDLGGKL